MPLLGPLLNSVIELHSELEHKKLDILDVTILCTKLAHVKTDIFRVLELHERTDIVSLAKSSKLGLDQVVVIITPADFTRDHLLSVPVEQHIGDENAIVVAEKIPDVPVAMIVPLDFTIKSIVRAENQLLLAKLYLLCGTGLIRDSCCVRTFVSSSCDHLLVIDQKRVIGKLATIN